MTKRIAATLRVAGVVGLLWWLLVMPAAAAGGLVKIDDPDNLLGGRRGDVERAAQQLAAKGPDVVVMVVRNDGGNPRDAATAVPYITRRLASIGVGGSPDNLPGNTILFFRATESQHSSVFSVQRYRTTLDPALGDIFNTKMRPAFSKNDVAGGMIGGLDAVRSALYPPTSPVAYGLGALVVVGALVLVLGPQLRKRQSAAAALQRSRNDVMTARNAAGAAIADLAQVLRTAQEKAQYDKLSYGPVDVERVGGLQQRGEQQFVEAQAIFDQAEADQTAANGQPSPAAYEQVAAAYGQARAMTEQAAAAIQEAEKLRAELDRAGQQRQPATGPTQHL